MAFIATAIIGGVSAIGGGLIAASGAKSAANTQANAANTAAQLTHQDTQQALDFQKQQYLNSLQLSMPWLTQGQSAVTNLGNLMGLMPQGTASTPGSAPLSGAPGSTSFGFPERPVFPSGTADKGAIDNPLRARFSAAGQVLDNGRSLRGDITPGSIPSGAPGANPLALNLPQPQVNPALGASGSLLTPWTEQFKAPDGLTEQNDPGFQARLKLGQDVMERSAAAKGNVLTGGTAKDLNSFAQDYASNEYGNVYNRAYNDYASRYNTFQNNQANTYNRLANMAGMGQVSANQLSTAGLMTGNNLSSTLMNSAGMLGQYAQNAGAARASGYQNVGNIMGNTVGSLGNLASLYAMMNQNKGGANPYATAPYEFGASNIYGNGPQT